MRTGRIAVKDILYPFLCYFSFSDHKYHTKRGKEGVMGKRVHIHGEAENPTETLVRYKRSKANSHKIEALSSAIYKQAGNPELQNVHVIVR